MKDLINSIDERDLDFPVIMPANGGIQGLFAFQDICPGHTGMVELGPTSFNEIPFRYAFLVAPHNFNHPCSTDESKNTLN